MMKGFGHLRDRVIGKFFLFDVAFVLWKLLSHGQPRSLKSPMPFIWRRRSEARQWACFGSA